MKNFLLTLAALGGMALLAAPAQAQYPYVTYYSGPTTVYSPGVTTYSYPYSYPVGPRSVVVQQSYRPVYAAPVYSAPVVSAPVVQQVYRTDYAPVVSSPVVQQVYRTDYAPTYAQPYEVYRTPVAAAPVVVQAPTYVARQRIYIPLQPVRNVIRAVTPGVPVVVY